ncbi:MAG: tryptophan synthase subunit alpha [Pelagibacteraceae bacterium]|nr:tryptophan synthase subunit alpha [Pelagibacteraceae bacterium]PPR52158.1 MAG: Tryptophan synthase alpha chain [Alphaproteobacteria bacterium MarineAlpha5_Bin10]|tara:strand:- start:5418 stop:6209 length:792 start_codon:yes stop_codon:yes gene_type:complete
MNKRIRNKFLTKSKKLITFVTAGDPDINTSLKIMKNLPIYGSDIIELGMPFSDPMADGPTIQMSSQRAIKNNVDLNKIFYMAKQFRKNNKTTPIILMGYYNPIYNYGNKKFINKCAESGIDGLIIVDLQPEFDQELYNLSSKKNIEFIRLITPTTNNTRLNNILPKAGGFLYYVSITGITGQNSANLNTLKKSIKELKIRTKIPICVGFGIKSPKQAGLISKFVDGVIVGSSIVKIIEKNSSKKIIIKKINNFVNSLSKAINK